MVSLGTHIDFVLRHKIHKLSFNSLKDDVEQIFTAKSFQSAGALSIKPFLAVDLETPKTDGS